MPKLVESSAKSGVLVCRVALDSVRDEQIVREMQEAMECESAKGSARAVVVDCSVLTGPASSQFLAMLVALRKKMATGGKQFAVCGLKGPLKNGFEIASLGRVITTYPSASEATWDLSGGGKRRPGGSSSSSPPPMRISVVVRKTAWAIVAAATIILAVVSIRSFFFRPVRIPDHVLLATSQGTEPFQSTLRGTCQRAGQPLGDVQIVAWPADGSGSPQPLATLLASGQSSATVHVAKTGPDGTFELVLPGVGEAHEFQLLLLAPGTDRAGAVSPHDQAVLQTAFSDARQAVGQRPYALLSCGIFPRRESQVVWDFAEPGQ